MKDVGSLKTNVPPPKITLSHYCVYMFCVLLFFAMSFGLWKGTD